MPLNKHFAGHGEEVMTSMKKTYKDPKEAESVFYATDNARKNRKGKRSGKRSTGRSGRR